MKLTEKRKEKLSRIFEDLGKLVFVSHVLGFLITPKIVDMPKIILGLFISIIFFVYALKIEED